MVTYPEVKKILDNLPANLDDVAFLSDAYRTLSSYDGAELSRQVKNALSRIRKFIDSETQKLYSPDSLSPENAVILNDYLSIYKEEELNTNQKQLKTDIEPLLDKFDQEHDISVDSTANINNIQNTWEDASAGAIPVFSIDRDNKIVIANEYREFEQLLAPLKYEDLQELIDVLHVNTIQDLAKTGATSLSGDAQLYSEKLKENLEKAEIQIRLAYLAIEKAEAAGKKAKDVDLEKAQEEYAITPEEIKNFNYAKIDSMRLASAVQAVSCANTAKSTFVGLRLQQKTNAQGVWYKVKQLKERVSQRHPKLYNFIKTGATAAKVAGINFALGATLGPIGVAGYGIYRTGKAIKKSYDAYQKKKSQAEAAGEKFHQNYIDYITAKENRLEAIGLAATGATSLVGLGYSGAAIGTGVIAAAGRDMAGKTIAVATVSLGSGVALQREQAKAVRELKQFFVEAGIDEEKISRKDLYLAPKKYCAQLIEKEGLKLSRTQKAEFEQKLDNVVKARAAKRARYASALIGSTAGIAAHEMAVGGALEGLGAKISNLLSRHSAGTTLSDNVDTLQELQSSPSSADTLQHTDTLQQNDTVKLDENIIDKESAPTNTPEKDIPQQKVSERLQQKANNTPRQETYTPAAAQKATYDTPAEQNVTTEKVADAHHTSSQDIGKLTNPAEYYAVSQPEDNVFITQGGTRVDLVEDDGRIEAIYSNEANNYSNAECAEIDKNVYCAITEKSQPTDIEGQFAREYETTNNLPPADLNKSAQVETTLTDEQVAEKLGLKGQNVSVRQVEQDGQNITRITVYPKSSQSTVNNPQLDSNGNIIGAVDIQADIKENSGIIVLPEQGKIEYQLSDEPLFHGKLQYNSNVHENQYYFYHNSKVPVDSDIQNALVNKITTTENNSFESYQYGQYRTDDKEFLINKATEDAHELTVHNIVYQELQNIDRPLTNIEKQFMQHHEQTMQKYGLEDALSHNHNAPAHENMNPYNHADQDRSPKIATEQRTPVQEQDHPLTPRERRQQARLERQQARAEARAREQAAEQWAAYDKQQGPTHKINMGPEYNGGYNGYGYGYNYNYAQPSYTIHEIPETGEPYLEISNYNPKVDQTLYQYVNSTRVNATNGVQYTEAMGGAIKGHPSNFDANAREFCTQLEQRDLVFKDLMNRQSAGYQLTAREARWVNDYQRDIAAYGLAYDHGRLVPILDKQHIMEKFYPNTIAQGHQVTDTVNYRAVNNRNWDPHAYNTNNSAQINVITHRSNGR